MSLSVKCLEESKFEMEKGAIVEILNKGGGGEKEDGFEHPSQRGETALL